MSSHLETIVAPITGLGPAPVAVVRLSGAESWDIAALLFEPWVVPIKPRYALYGRFVTGDDGLALPFELGGSYTGERSVELSLHGSPASIRALIEVAVRAGARIARPGEFTERAFLNGRIDLTQAEGVRDSIDAATQAQLRQANLLREGALRDEIVSVREKVLVVLATIEASVDFSEEVGELDREGAMNRIRDAIDRIQGLLHTAEAGRLLRRGLRIAIVGPPNAGKSSLLNALLGYDRSIVTEIPGTTRDFVEEPLDLGGVACVLTDTAGLRDTEDRLESLGMERTWKVAAAADRVWYVYDQSAGWTDEDAQALSRANVPTQVLANKADLQSDNRSPDGALAISAKTREGLDRLVAVVSDELARAPMDTVWINDRHVPLLITALESLTAAAQTLSRDIPFDLSTVHLQCALEALGEVTGETACDDMLDRIFRDFCVGK